MPAPHGLFTVMCTGQTINISSFSCSFISVPVYINSSRAQDFNLDSPCLSKHMQKNYALHRFTPNKPTMKSAVSAVAQERPHVPALSQPFTHQINYFPP